MAAWNEREKVEATIVSGGGFFPLKRAFLLERGVPVRQGLQYLRAELPRILATPPDILSARIHDWATRPTVRADKECP
jgi:hypothetical protein